MSFIIPAQRIYESDRLVAFHHPRPSYPVHILLVPKKSVASLSELEPSDYGFLGDLLLCVQNLVVELNLEEPGYRLIVNGGKYQEIPQLHFHLVSGAAE
jgi:histidine triad (HIT) family protein